MSDQPRPDVDAANFRATIITSFLLGATMILLSLNATIIRQSVSTGAFGVVEWALSLSIVLMLFSTLVMLFMTAVILQTVYLAPFTIQEKLKRVSWARMLLGASSIIIPTSLGSTFLVSLGTSSAWGWIFGAVGYGSGILWAFFRWYYLKKFVHPWMKSLQ